MNFDELWHLLLRLHTSKRILLRRLLTMSRKRDPKSLLKTSSRLEIAF
jgi:hypothetical protein